MSETSSVLPGSFMASGLAVESAIDDIHLLLARQPHEVDRVAGNADGELRVFLRVVHGVEQHLAVENVDVGMIPCAAEKSVEQTDEVSGLVIWRAAQTAGHHRRRQ